MKVTVCIGSSCHLKGSRQIVELLQKEIETRNLSDKVTLAGNFCLGKCNRIGVTVQVDDEVYTGVTQEGFGNFFESSIMAKLNA